MTLVDTNVLFDVVSATGTGRHGRCSSYEDAAVAGPLAIDAVRSLWEHQGT
jgi:hypothetical protein